MKLEDGGYPELKSDLKQFLNSGKWQPELQSGQQLPENSKGVGRCQFADGIYSYFVLRIVFKHYFHHSILLGSCIRAAFCHRQKPEELCSH